jgi:release factor glutamine methyltransferase
MNLQQLKSYFYLETLSTLGEEECESYFLWMIENILQKTRIDVISNLDFQISIEDIEKIETIIAKIKTNEPIQYIFNEAFFYGHQFYVTKDVLIPRPETEQLVEVIENQLDKSKKYKIIDICTGSGCIAISLSKIFQDSEVFAIDIDENALKIAQINNKNLKSKVQFKQLDILTETLSDKYDVIVSNPPYIRNKEKQLMKANVLEFEPHLALFVSDENPLIFYERIAVLAKKSLVKNGLLFFEINQYLGKETKILVENLGFSQVEIIKDFRNNDRILKAVIE